LKEDGQKICVLKVCNLLNGEYMKEVSKMTKKKGKDSFDGQMENFIRDNG